MPKEAFSPALPPPNCFSPMCINPLRKVPLVRITVFALISRPKEVLTPTTFEPEISRPETIS